MLPGRNCLLCRYYDQSSMPLKVSQFVSEFQVSFEQKLADNLDLLPLVMLVLLVLTHGSHHWVLSH